MLNWNDLTGVKVTVMGLGLNGGGLASARFFAGRGATVTVTDLRDETVLAPSIAALKGFDIRYVLGRHDNADFADADLVIRNPAVRNDNPYLALAKAVETDISVFLQVNKNPVYAVTGSKGKSTTVSALHAIFQATYPGTRLGGNITVSPLSFLDELDGTSPVVLELSSWQLRDLRGRGVLAPRVSGITNLLRDHLNAYGGSMELYALDKQEIFAGQAPDSWTVLNLDQDWGRTFAAACPTRLAAVSAAGRPTFAGAQARAWLDSDRALFEQDAQTVSLFSGPLLVPGQAFRFNCLFAAVYAKLAGISPAAIQQALSAFGGIEHRMEKFASWNGIDFYNDTAATIPDAAVASFASFDRPVHWITGGTDKELSFEPYQTLTRTPASVTLLHGSASAQLLPLLQAKHWPVSGPTADFPAAVQAVCQQARPGDIVLLSPGAASFEMFKNEFDRGHQFKALVRAWIGAQG